MALLIATAHSRARGSRTLSSSAGPMMQGGVEIITVRHGVAQECTHSCSHVLWLSQNWTPVSLTPTQGTPHPTSGFPTLLRLWSLCCHTPGSTPHLLWYYKASGREAVGAQGQAPHSLPSGNPLLVGVRDPTMAISIPLDRAPQCPCRARPTERLLPVPGSGTEWV